LIELIGTAIAGVDEAVAGVSDVAVVPVLPASVGGGVVVAGAVTSSARTGTAPSKNNENILQEMSPATSRVIQLFLRLIIT
jgi:hypothetical protein